MKTILIAGGDENVRILIQKSLEASDRRIQTASTAVGALEFALKERPDVIVLDEVVPNLDWPVVLKALRQNPAAAHIPVILLTSRGHELERRHALAVGFNACFIKPCNPFDLLQTIEQILEQENEETERNAA